MYGHVVWFGLWILLNTDRVGVRAFDPFPYGLLTMIVSLEAIFLSAVVLISQNRLSAEIERRADLDPHIGLLTEHELTRVLQMLDAIQRKPGIDDRRGQRARGPRDGNQARRRAGGNRAPPTACARRDGDRVISPGAAGMDQGPLARAIGPAHLGGTGGPWWEVMRGGNPVDRSRGVVRARWRRLGIFALAQVVIRARLASRAGPDRTAEIERLSRPPARRRPAGARRLLNG